MRFLWEGVIASFNTTNVTGYNSSLSYHHPHSNGSAQRFSTDTANNLGYGIGRLLRGTFDSLWNIWHKTWVQEPSAIEVARQRNTMIYQGGLSECVKLLGPALANLERNPNDRGALKKVRQLAAHFARYLKPSNEENLRELQSKILQPLEERVSDLAHLNLSKWMPVFFQESNQKAKRSIQTGFTAYVTSGPQNSVYAIDTFSNEVIANVSVGSYSSGIAITPNSRYVYATNWLSNFVSVIDTSSNQVIANVTVDQGPRSIAITHSGLYAYVLNWATRIKNGTISIIETSNNSVKTTISPHLDLSEIAITPNDLYAYILSHDSDLVSVMETVTNTFLTTISLGNPYGIAITHNGLYAYVGNKYRNDNFVSAINTSDNKVIATIPLNASASKIAITPDDLYALVTSLTGNTITVIETTNNTVFTTIEVGHGSYGIAITHDGLYAYATTDSFQTISLINTTSNTVIATFNLRGLNIAITPTTTPHPPTSPPIPGGNKGLIIGLGCAVGVLGSLLLLSVVIYLKKNEGEKQNESDKLINSS